MHLSLKAKFYFTATDGIYNAYEFEVRKQLKKMLAF